MRLKKETRLTLYVAAWAITLVMGMSGQPATLGNLALNIEPEPEVSVLVRSAQDISTSIDKSDSYERTSTLESEQNQAEYAQDNAPSGFTLGGYMEWRKAVAAGHCDTLVRDTKQWLIDRGYVEANNNRKAQRLAEQYLSDAEQSGFVRVVDGWVSGMRQKYEWTGQAA